ncbi:helix-turn-helix domain-containing protein [Ruficoccus sp. ZRK36]|nr:helix-turn-helix domain-containing protein [Ruficoccus sp. ZRK36]
MSEDTIRIQEAAKRIGMSKRSLYRLIADGKFPRPLKEHGRARYLEAEIEAYLERTRKVRA